MNHVFDLNILIYSLHITQCTPGEASNTITYTKYNNWFCDIHSIVLARSLFYRIFEINWNIQCCRRMLSHTRPGSINTPQALIYDSLYYYTIRPINDNFVGMAYVFFQIYFFIFQFI